MNKLNAKFVGAALLLSTLTATAQTQTVPVMTFDTLKGLNNLNRNMKAERIFPRNNLFERTRANEFDTLAYPRFRGIDMSDEPLLSSAKQMKAKEAQQKPQSQSQNIDNIDKDDSVSSED